MTNQPAGPPRPALDLRGAVDLGALAPRRPAAEPPAGNGAGALGGADAAGAPGDAVPGAAGAFSREVTDATFATDVLAVSMTVPVVIDFWAAWCGPCRQLSPVLEKLAAEYDGRILLAKVDVDANPQLAGAFQVQSIPSVFAVLKQQPVPLFQGAQPEPQVRAVLTELLRVAEANGVTGRLERDPAAAAADEEAPEPVEEPLPPLIQAAYDAIERDDLTGAVAAYEQALKENPADEEARVGLAQVRLMQRTDGVDPVAARATAASSPENIEAQLLAADLDLQEGLVDDAFTRLIEKVRLTAGDERERVRSHLVELFELVGPADPRVAKARGKLASALF